MPSLCLRRMARAWSTPATMPITAYSALLATSAAALLAGNPDLVVTVPGTNLGEWTSGAWS